MRGIGFENVYRLDVSRELKTPCAGVSGGMRSDAKSILLGPNSRSMRLSAKLCERLWLAAKGLLQAVSEVSIFPVENFGHQRRSERGVVVR